MSARRFLSTTGDVALQLLQRTAASADVFPPLKSAAELALHIAEIVKDFRSNKDQWIEFGEYIRDATASVVQSLDQIDASRGDTRSKLEKLNGTLDETAKTIESELQPKRRRLLKPRKDVEKMEEMRRRVDTDIGLFQLTATMTTMIDVGRVSDAVTANGNTLSSIARDTSAAVVMAASIERKASLLGLDATLDKLLRVPGASWDPLRVCMQNTRVELINDVMMWIEGPTSANGASPSGGAKIMLMTAVAGGGKTTMAHTVASQCARNKQLGSSFFFDRETEGRNTPAALFTTIAADLSRLDDGLAKCITAAIEGDRSLPSAPMFRQFEELLLEPCRECPLAGPIVLVIDAVDEAWNEDLLDILRDHAQKLPNTFRIFITSRMRPELDCLLRQSHVTGIEINIHAQSNLDDIAVYAPHKLWQLSCRRNLGGGWPGLQLRAEFTAKAGGLFLWVATVCTYLCNRDDPEEELARLVSKTELPASSAEDQMNKLYARILENFDWTDPSFVAGYRRVMGTAIATKTPITISAMKELYHGQRLATDYTLQKLSPLLTGMSKADHGSEPVRVLHQSLRDFLVIQTTSSPRPMQFNIVEKEQSQQLALLCLQLLNRDLSRSIPGTGYLDEDEDEDEEEDEEGGGGEEGEDDEDDEDEDKDKDEKPGVPVISENAVSGALWYACQFWPDHVLDIESLREIGEVLGRFMDEKTILWMEVVAARGRCRGLNEVRNLLEGTNAETGLIPKSRKEYASASLCLSIRLKYEDRREEALAMAEEAVQLYQQLAAERPAGFTSDLATSLNNLSICLSDLGRREDALTAIQKAVQLYRELAAERPAAFTPGLADSLNNISVDLSNLGRCKEALAAIQEAVQLRRELAADRPAAFSPGLPDSLDNLSSCLSDLGRRKEALVAIQQAVQLRRELAADRPAAFTPDLAMSLNNLSNRLSDLGRREDALTAIQEAVQLYQELAAERPAAFTPGLAMSLNNLSNRQSDPGRREDALTAIQEAVQLYRELAAERPAAFTPDLAMSLNNLSIHLSNLGRCEDALMTIQEAVQLHRELAAERPAAFTPDLAKSLKNLSNRLSDLGRREDALTAIQEAVQLRRELAAGRPAAFTPDLAMSLNNLSLHLSGLGRREDALTAIQEAGQLYRELAAERPAAFTSDLAMSLNNLSASLSGLGHRDEALTAIQEAVTLRRQLATARPFIFNSVLKQSLCDLADLLTTMGQLPVASAAKDEANTLSS